MNKEYEIQIEIENRCYLDCCHCSSYLISNYENTLKEKELVDLLQLFDMPIHIYFSGGEPLANSNLLSYVRLVKAVSKRNKVGIFTCGVLYNNVPIDTIYAKMLKKNGLDDCYISLYHYIPEKHDQVTNQKGSYFITIRSIQNLLSESIDVKIHLVINRFNYLELNKVIFNILKLGVSQVRLLRIVKTGLAEINWEFIGVPYEQQNMAIERIIDNISGYSGAVTISGFPALTACRPAPNAIKCQAGTHLLYVNNSKQVFPCACTKNNPSFMIGTLDELNIIKNYIKRQQLQTFNENCLNPIST